MLRNYLKMAQRNLQRRPVYTLINVAGLAVGIACCTLILLFVRDELSYDRFHEKAERVYQLAYEAERRGKTQRGNIIPAGLAPALEDGRSEVEHAVRINGPNELLLAHEARHFYEKDLYYVDAAVFDVFTLPLLEGNAATALVEPFSIVLDEALARKYFGDDPALGQTLEIDNEHLYTVTGVMRRVPAQTHWRPRGLVSFSTLRSLGRQALDAFGGYFAYSTYLLLRQSEDVGALEEALPSFFERLAGADAWASQAAFFLQSLPDLYLRSQVDVGPAGSLRTLYIFSAIAVLVLLIACVNYMNLATARSAQRTREVGVRKTVGARQGQLVRQFLTESVGLSLLALLIGLALVQLVLPPFNQLMDKEIMFALTQEGPLLAGLFILSLLVGILSGSYPALLLSAVRPAEVIKGQTRLVSGRQLHKVLVVFQFGVTVVLIASTLVMQRQLRFAQDLRISTQPEQVLVVSIDRESPVRTQAEAFEQALQRHPDILRTSAAEAVPGRIEWSTVAEEVEGVEEEVYETLLVSSIAVDPDYAETLGLHLRAGRDFSPEQDAGPFGQETLRPLVVNQAAVEALGLEDPLGTAMSVAHLQGRIVGVFEDFHFESVHEAIRPLIFHPPGNNPRYVLIRFDTDDVAGVLQNVAAVWQRFDSDHPLVHFFLDDAFARLYASDRRLASLFSAFSGLAIFVACLGLFGLAAYTAEQRTKEVGIRKALGASVTNLVVLLSKDFLKLVLIAVIIAAPVAYIAIHRWLEDFAYRIEIGLGVFVLAGGLVLVIAWLTVSYRSIKAALADPVKSLRYE